MMLLNLPHQVQVYCGRHISKCHKVVLGQSNCLSQVYKIRLFFSSNFPFICDFKSFFDIWGRRCGSCTSSRKCSFPSSLLCFSQCHTSSSPSSSRFSLLYSRSTSASFYFFAQSTCKWKQMREFALASTIFTSKWLFFFIMFEELTWKKTPRSCRCSMWAPLASLTCSRLSSGRQTSSSPRSSYEECLMWGRTKHYYFKQKD